MTGRMWVVAAVCTREPPLSAASTPPCRGSAAVLILTAHRALPTLPSKLPLSSVILAVAIASSMPPLRGNDSPDLTHFWIQFIVLSVAPIYVAVI